MSDIVTGPMAAKVDADIGHEAIDKSHCLTASLPHCKFWWVSLRSTHPTKRHANAGMTSAANNSTERIASAWLIEPKAKSQTK